MPRDENIALVTANEVFAQTDVGQAYGFVFKHSETEIYDQIIGYVIQAEAFGLSREEIAVAAATYVYFCMLETRGD